MALSTPKLVENQALQLKLVLMISQKSAGARTTILWMIFHHFVQCSAFSPGTDAERKKKQMMRAATLKNDPA